MWNDLVHVRSLSCHGLFVQEVLALTLGDEGVSNRSLMVFTLMMVQAQKRKIGLKVTLTSGKSKSLQGDVLLLRIPKRIESNSTTTSRRIQWQDTSALDLGLSNLMLDGDDVPSEDGDDEGVDGGDAEAGGGDPLGIVPVPLRMDGLSVKTALHGSWHSSVHASAPKMVLAPCQSR